MSDSPKQLQNARVSVFNLNSSGTKAALGVVQLDSTGGIISGGVGGGSTQVSIKEILTSSGASVMDSTNSAIKVNVVAGSGGALSGSIGSPVPATATPVGFKDASSNLAYIQLSTSGAVPVSGAMSLAGNVTLGTINQAVSPQTVGALDDAAVTSLGVAVFQIPSGLTGTISFEMSIDGSTNWTSEGAWLSDGSYATAVASFPCWGTLPNHAFHRLRVSSYGSGSADISVTYYDFMPLPLGQNVRGTVSQGAHNSSGSNAWPTASVDSSNAIVKPGDSANNALRVNVVAGAAGGSTVMTVSTGSVRVHQSTATDLLGRMNQGVGNSSAADRWRVMTANSSAADYNAVRLVDSSGTGYHGPTKPLPIALTDSSNAVVLPADSANNAVRVNVIASAVGGTEYTEGDVDSTPNGGAIFFNNSSDTLRCVSSTLGLPVNVIGGTISASTIVTVSTGSIRVHQSTATDLLARVNQGVGNSSAADRWRVTNANSSAADFNPVRIVDSSGTGFHGPAKPMPIAVTDSSNAVVLSGDSANNAIRVNVVAGAAGGSTIVTVSTGSVRVHQSTNTDLLARAFQGAGNSSGADAWPTLTVDSSNAIVKPGDSANNALRVNVVAGAAGGSTIVTVSTGSVRVHQSTAADLLVTVYPQSSVAPSSGSSAIVVRPVIDAILSTGSTSFFGGGSNSTAFTLQSSGAGLRAYVTAYSFTSTNQAPFTIGFYSSNNLVAPIRLSALSSAVTGANLAVGAPAYLFRTEAAAALSIRVDQSSRTGDVGWVSWFVAP